jgi:hypothetical protein
MTTSDISLHLPYHYDKNVDQRAINMREIERMLNGIITGDIPIAGSGTWADWTPVVTCSAGTITAYTATGRYAIISGTIFYTANINISNIGTGTTELLMVLPDTATGTPYIGSGIEVGVTGDSVILRTTNNTQASIYFYSGAFPGATGANFFISGFYESV